MEPTHLTQANQLWVQGLEGHNKVTLLKALLKAAEFTQQDFVNTRKPDVHYMGLVYAIKQEELPVSWKERFEWLMGSVEARYSKWFDAEKKEIFSKAWGLNGRQTTSLESFLSLTPTTVVRETNLFDINPVKYFQDFEREHAQVSRFTPEASFDHALAAAWQSLRTPIERFAVLFKHARSAAVEQTRSTLSLTTMAELALGMRGIESFEEARGIQIALRRARLDTRIKGTLSEMYAKECNLNPGTGEQLPTQEELAGREEQARKWHKDKLEAVKKAPHADITFR